MPPSLRGSTSDSMGNLQNSFQIGRSKYATGRGNGPVGARNSGAASSSNERTHTKANSPILTIANNRKRKHSSSFKPDVSPLTLRSPHQQTKGPDGALSLRSNSSDDTIDNTSKSSSQTPRAERDSTVSDSSSSTALVEDVRSPSFKSEKDLAIYTPPSNSMKTPCPALTRPCPDSPSGALASTRRRSDDRTSDHLGSLTSTKSTHSSTRVEMVAPKTSCPAKFRCTHCQGDVRRPPINMTATVSGGENSAKNILRQVQPVIFCSSRKCHSPQYHLHCSGVPTKSQIYHNETSFDPERVLASESTANSLATAWWNIPIRRDLMFDDDHVPAQLSSRDAMFGAFQLYEVDRMSSISSFVCNSCDVEGTSRYLLEYFELFHAMKKSFYSRYLNEDSAVRLERMSECVEARVGDEFLHHMIRIHATERGDNEEETRSERSKKNNQSITLDDCVGSELHISHMTNVLRLLSKQLPQDTQASSRLDNKHKIAVGAGSAMANGQSFTEENYSTTASRIKRARAECRAARSSENNINAEPASNQCCSQHSTSDTVYYDRVKLDPTYLVGMPLQIFNPVDNSYHCGRIVKCKTKAPFKVDESDVDSKIIGNLIDEDISNTMYLVRFREGMDGRKVTVHQWLYLEEHAVVVGAEVCWAKISCDPDPSIFCERNPILMSPYRPVQIVFRSMLEINSASDRKYVGRSSNNGSHPIDVLARGFGDVFSFVHITLQESDYVTRESSKAFAQSAEVNPQPRASALLSLDSSKQYNKKPSPTVFPFRFRDPLWLNEMLRRVRLTDEDVGVAVAMACVESNEKKMIRLSQNLEN